ncbi:MAG: hypothetical protein AAFY56_24600 [Pseudomonadota bacterium]
MGPALAKTVLFCALVEAVVDKREQLGRNLLNPNVDALDMERVLGTKLVQGFRREETVEIRRIVCNESAQNRPRGLAIELGVAAKRSLVLFKRVWPTCHARASIFRHPAILYLQPNCGNTE